MGLGLGFRVYGLWLLWLSIEAGSARDCTFSLSFSLSLYVSLFFDVSLSLSLAGSLSLSLSLSFALSRSLALSIALSEQATTWCRAFVYASQGQDLALTVLYVPYSLDSGRVVAQVRAVQLLPLSSEAVDLRARRVEGCGAAVGLQRLVPFERF